MSIKGETESNIWIVSFQGFRIAKNAIPFPFLLLQIKTFKSLYLKLLYLKLMKNWIFIFWPVAGLRVAEVVEIYSFCGFMINLCKFSMVKIPIGSLKAFDILWNLVINWSTAWNSTQGRASKGPSFWNLQRISFLGRFTCKTILDVATLARLQNALCNGFWKCAFLRGESLISSYVYNNY